MKLPAPSLQLPTDTSDTAFAEQPPVGVEQYVARLALSLPSGVTARSPVPVALSRAYGEYRSSYELKGDTLFAERSVRLDRRMLSAVQKRDYAAFVHAIQEDERQELALERPTGGGQPAVPETATADELHQSGLAALNSGDFRTAIGLFKRVVQLEPKHAWAWNNLGLAYLGTGMLDSAIVSLRKQIAINPYDQYAYNNLGRAYRRRGNYEDAAEAFKRQIEINPLDHYAHANLGRLYVEQHRDSAALPELEQAAKITPNDPDIHVDLGRVELSLSHPEAAQREFERAVELAPVPPIWNNVAYAYAQRGVSLERAEQYARAAVDATAARLRNVSLDRVGPPDLGMATSLGAYWDTLGWVYFRRGDLATAERYVRAAWLLTFYGEVGDHLGQIQERTGRKEEAIRTYAEALVTRDPVPETRARLTALVGAGRKLDELVDRARGDLVMMRSVRLATKRLEDLQGRVTLLFSPGPKVEDIKFEEGGERLQALSDALRVATYSIVFPDSTPFKLPRRGVVTCSSATGECMVVLEAESVTSDRVVAPRRVFKSP